MRTIQQVVDVWKAKELVGKKRTRISFDGSYPCNPVRVSPTLFGKPMPLAMVEKSPENFPQFL